MSIINPHKGVCNMQKLNKSKSNIEQELSELAIQETMAKNADLKKSIQKKVDAKIIELANLNNSIVLGKETVFKPAKERKAQIVKTKQKKN